MSGDNMFLQRIAKSAVVSLGIVALSSISSAYSQTIEVSNDGSIMLDGISVYATRGETDAFSVPGMVAVIDKSAMEDMIVNSADDIFKGTPGVQFSGGPRRSGQTPSIRGFSGNSVLIMFDDARQSFDSGHNGRFLIDTDILKRVEVVKGPSSALYGSGTAGGVIAFQTVDAADLLEDGEKMGVKFKAGYQSVDDERSASVTAFARTSNGNFDFVGHLGVRDSSDIELGDGNTLPADDKLANAFVKTKFRVAKNTDITTSYIYTKLDSLEPSNPQNGAVVTPHRNPLVDRTTKSSTFQTKLTHSPSDNPLLDFKIAGYLTNNEVENTEVDNGKNTVQKIKTVGLTAQNRSRVTLSKNADVLFTYGGEIYKDEQTGTDSTSGSGERDGVPNATARFMGAFAQAQFTVDDALPGTLTITPGIRFDKFETNSELDNAIDETAVSPKVALAYEPTKWMMLFGNYGEAFRAPSFNEAYASGIHFVIPTPGGVIVNRFITNPDLKPEETRGWEVGAGLNFGDVIAKNDRLKLKGSYWKSDVKNLIDLVVTQTTTQNVNTANADMNGFEIVLSYDSDVFYTTATYSHIDGRDKDTGAYLGILTPDKLFIDAGVKLAPYDMRVGARATFADDFDKVNPPTRPGQLPGNRDGYTTVDLYAAWEPTQAKLKGLKLNVGVDNVFDEDYEVVAAGAKEPGRNFKASIGYKIPLCGSGLCGK